MPLLSGIDPAAFKTTVRGKPVDLYVLTNSAGAEACFSNFAAILVSFVVPDKSGKPVDIVLGQPTIAAYVDNPTTFLGAGVGRYSNRIANGKFTLNGQSYTLQVNNGPNNLHSGETGFHNQVFEVLESSSESILFKYVSPDGENGFPGTVETKMRWTLTADNALVMETTATTDKPTYLSITNHSFFNLDGGYCDAMTTVLQINANWYLPTDKTNIPYGEIRPVEGTNFDFRKPTPIAARIDDQTDPQLVIGAGYDHTFVINRSDPGELTTGAVAYSEKSGIVLEVKSTLPGVQLYSGNWLNGVPGKTPGSKNDRRTAFCLEAQYFPDSPNQAQFPSALVVPGQVYKHTIVFKASTR
jgi:aldose 1-epimerase